MSKWFCDFRKWTYAGVKFNSVRVCNVSNLVKQGNADVLYFNLKNSQIYIKCNEDFSRIHPSGLGKVLEKSTEDLLRKKNAEPFSFESTPLKPNPDSYRDHRIKLIRG